ncbi:MAG: TonB-dependent receptor [Bacteroidales bacterium]|nr:TonB-dependent receptor [Bacteroidales bacterium]
MTRLVFYLILLGLLPVHAMYSQNVTMSIAVENLPMRDALRQIERKSGMRFFMSDDLAVMDKRVSFNLKNKSFEQVMYSVLNDYNLSYKIFENSLVVITETSVFQGISITGIVKDSNGETLPGVNIRVVGTTIGVVTDVNGRYTINAPIRDAVLSFSFMGYATQEIPVGDRTGIDVTLFEEASEIEEVVVIGYGTVKKANVVGSIAKIDEKALADRPITRVEQALQGQVSGVSVRQTSGSPGSDITIQVRGAASISGQSTPLYVVDGVPIDNLSGINPSDIRSIDVLKDAASAAIYGSRGSNGVILVTTKRGRTGKPVISLSAYTALSNVERYVDVLDADQWIEFNKKWYDRVWVNRTGLSASATQEERLTYARGETHKPYTTRAEINEDKGVYGLYDPWWGTDNLEEVNWQREVFRTAPTHDIQLNASGATENINYSISGGIYSQEGIIHGSSYDRYSLRANVESKINNRVKVGISLAPSYGISEGGNIEGKDLAVSRALGLPNLAPKGAGKMAGADPYKFYDMWGPGANNVSPYVMAKYQNIRKVYDTRVNSALTTTVDIVKGLNVQGMVAWNYRGNSERTYNPTWAQGTWNTNPAGKLSSSGKRTTVSNSLLAQALLNYNKQIGIHSFDVLLGASEEKFNQETTRQQKNDFPDDKTWVFTTSRGANTTQNEIGYSENALISYFGRLQYGLMDKYLFQVSLRHDGSSKFGPNNRWGWFPSVSGAWRANEEDFLKDADWLGTAKLRVSWGLAGNDRIGNSQFVANMAQLNYPYGDAQAIGTGFVVGNISNFYLGWEQTASYNFGIDFGLWKDRIYLSADFYFKKTNDLLLSAPVSLTTGFATMMDNVGSVENKGFELEINSANLTGKLRWNTSFNLSLNRNKITSLGAENTDITSGQGNTIIQRVGYPINSYYLLKVDGVLRAADFEANGVTPKPGVATYANARAGDAKWRDVAGNPDGSPDNKITAADYIVAGNFEPKFEWGMTNTFYYGNFDASLLVQGRVGGDLLSIGSRSWNRPTSGPGWNYMEQWLTKAYWSEEEPGDGNTPAFFASSITGGQYDTNWMYSAGYFRIKNFTLGYTVPVKKAILSQCRFYVSIDNIYMWDSYYPGFSPEAATQDNASSDWGAYPQARTYSLGVNLTF